MKPKPLSVLKSLEEKYVAVMKKLQFGKLKLYSLFLQLSFYIFNSAIEMCSSKIKEFQTCFYHELFIYSMYVCMYVYIYTHAKIFIIFLSLNLYLCL